MNNIIQKQTFTKHLHRNRNRIALDSEDIENAPVAWGLNSILLFKKLGKNDFNTLYND